MLHKKGVWSKSAPQIMSVLGVRLQLLNIYYKKTYQNTFLLLFMSKPN